MIGLVESIHANGKNHHGLSLQDELMRNSASHRGTQLSVATKRPVRDGEVPATR